MITVERLTKTFAANGNDVTAVNDVSFQLNKGTLAAIVGKSGSGKSTLLSLLGALEKPTSGNIIVGDLTLTELGDSDLIRYRRTAIGFIFQNYNLIPNLTARQNVMLPMEFAGVPNAKRRHRAEALLTDVELTGEKMDRRPGRLSGGEQQRVAIARALANQPKLLLADEPTGNLDTQTSRLIITMLHRLAREQETTVIVVTHDDGIAGRADQLFRLHDGHLRHESRRRHE